MCENLFEALPEGPSQVSFFFFFGGPHLACLGLWCGWGALRISYPITKIVCARFRRCGAQKALQAGCLHAGMKSD